MHGNALPYSVDNDNVSMIMPYHCVENYLIVLRMILHVAMHDIAFS